MSEGKVIEIRMVLNHLGIDYLKWISYEEQHRIREERLPSEEPPSASTKSAAAAKESGT